MSNVVKMRPDKPLTVEEQAQQAVDDLTRDLLALGIDINAVDEDDDDEDDEGEQ